MGARPQEGSHLVWRYSQEVYTGANLAKDRGFPCWILARIGVQDGYRARPLAPVVRLNDMFVVR